MALIRSGDKLLLAHRRLFEADQSRYFAGVVDEYEDDIARITGHTFVRESVRGAFLRKEDARTKLISLSAGTLIVYLLPAQTQLDALRLEERGKHRLVLTDGVALEMDMTDRVDGVASPRS